MEETILCLGIEGESENEGEMWFDLNHPQTLADYIRDNIERDEARVFIVKEMPKNEFEALD